MRTFWTGLFIFTFVFSGTSQLKQITEEDVNNQTAYIDALSPSLIGEEQEAIERMERYIEDHPTRHAAFYQLARLYKTTGDERDCLHAIEKAVTLDPDNEWYQLTEAQYLEDFNHWVRAGEAYESLMALKPEHSNYWLSAAHAYLNAGDPRKSLRILNELEGKVGLDAEIARKKFLIFKSLGNYSEAETVMQELIDHYPKNTSYLMILAGLYAEMGQKEKELALYDKVLLIDSTVTEARIRKSELESATEGELLEQLLPVVKDPESSIDLKIEKLVYFLENVDAEHKEESQQLIAALKELVRAHPRDAKSHTMLADGYFNTGHLREALQHYQKAEELQSNISTVWLQHLKTLALLDEHEKVLEVAEKAFVYFPNQIEIYLLATEAALNLDQIETAREYLESSSFMVGRIQEFRQRYDALSTLVADALGEKGQVESYILDMANADFIVPAAALLLLEYHTVTNQDWLNKVKSQAKGRMKGDYLAQIAAAYAAYEEKKYNEAEKFLDAGENLGASIDPRIHLLRHQIQLQENNAEGLEKSEERLREMGYELKTGEG